jgi:hypothetical protein
MYRTIDVHHPDANPIQTITATAATTRISHIHVFARRAKSSAMAAR